MQGHTVPASFMSWLYCNRVRMGVLACLNEVLSIEYCSQFAPSRTLAGCEAKPHHRVAVTLMSLKT
jgi:hypothetical protein